MPHPLDPIRTPITDSESDIQNGLPRTNVRTDVDTSDGCKSGNGSRRGRAYEDSTRAIAELLSERTRRLNIADPDAIPTVSVVMDGFLDHLEHLAGRRWPVVRSGEREPIPWLIRLSVWKRDGFACCNCGRDMHDDHDFIELDHCVPWSAGGSDESSNLRVLCQWCNQMRSNFIDFAHDTIYRPTTWWCLDCWTPERHRPFGVWRDGSQPNRVPLIDAETGLSELVYCARCDRHTLSPFYFAGRVGAELLRLAGPETTHPAVATSAATHESEAL